MAGVDKRACHLQTCNLHMCGISGILNFDRENSVDETVIRKMTDTIVHRGPDGASVFTDGRVGFGFRRLSIIDIDHGMQPFFSPDGSIVLICNGEIYNYKELRAEMNARGHVTKTNCDVEIIVFLYMEYGVECIKKLNGQFAFALYDKKINQLFLGRDQFGICPLFYARTAESFVFGSEIKSIIQAPGVSREVNLNGLDQIFSFPGNIAPTTIFKGVHCLEAGHFALLRDGQLSNYEYWNLEYPDDGQQGSHTEQYYLDGLEELLLQSIKYRLISDVPVGFYLSGGLDSSLIGGMMRRLKNGDDFKSFSICFSNEKENKDINEQRFQRMVSEHINSQHHEVEFEWSNFESKIRDVIYHAETPLKETYNVCSLALSDLAQRENVKVVLCGEGADELFGGYAGYKFDRRSAENGSSFRDLQQIKREEVCNTLWGNPKFVYEKDEYDFSDTKSALYSDGVNSVYRDFNSIRKPAVDHKRLRNKHIFHQRSYVDFKLRLAGHLIADHGDRMTMANSVEGRYPFLDVNLIEFIKQIPPSLMLHGMTEKYPLKRLGEKYIPRQIINREKFGFVAPGSPQLLKSRNAWANDLLSYDTIKRQGFFNPDTIEHLKKLYVSDNFILNPPYDMDLLIIVITFNTLLEVFDVSLP